MRSLRTAALVLGLVAALVCLTGGPPRGGAVPAPPPKEAWAGTYAHYVPVAQVGLGFGGCALNGGFGGCCGGFNCGFNGFNMMGINGQVPGGNGGPNGFNGGMFGFGGQPMPALNFGGVGGGFGGQPINFGGMGGGMIGMGGFNGFNGFNGFHLLPYNYTLKTEGNTYWLQADAEKRRAFTASKEGVFHEVKGMERLEMVQVRFPASGHEVVILRDRLGRLFIKEGPPPIKPKK